MPKILILVLFFLTLNACVKNEVNNGFVFFNNPFTLKLNKNGRVVLLSKPDSSLIVYFKKVIVDNRCANASCSTCYGSTAKIQIIMVHNKDTSNISLSILGCRDEYSCDDMLYYRKDTLGYRFCLLRLDPNPDGKIINQQLYSVKLNISKL